MDEKLILGIVDKKNGMISTQMEWIFRDIKNHFSSERCSLRYCEALLPVNS